MERPARLDWSHRGDIGHSIHGMELGGIKRKVEVSAPTMAALPRMVVGTDRIATVHKRLALQAEKILPVRLWQPPLEVPTLVQKLQWHRHRDADPALAWVRALALRVGKII